MRPLRNGIALRTLAIGLLLALAGPAPAAGWFRSPEQSLPATCLRAALADYPGKIERIHVNAPGSASIARIYIEQADRREWIVFCNLKTGRIDRAILVDEL